MQINIRVLIVVALLGASIGLRAQVPQIISYQGKLTLYGTNFSGAGQFKFALVNSSGAVSYWSNDGSSSGGSAPTAAVPLPVANGLFNVMLGDTNLANMTVPIPLGIFTNLDVRLRIWFSDGVIAYQQPSPDQRIGSVSYAMNAASATSALGLIPGAAISGSFTGNGAGLTNLNASQLSSGTIPLAQLPPAVVTNGEPSVTLGSLTVMGDVVAARLNIGSGNTLSGSHPTIAGGYGNNATGSAATVSGGNNNTASSSVATVGGGSWNIAAGVHATVGGGLTNTAGGSHAHGRWRLGQHRERCRSRGGRRQR